MRGLVLTVLLALVGATGAAAAPPPPLSAYGQLPALESVALSPGGGRVAFISVSGADRVLKVVNVDDRTLLSSLRVGSVKIRDLEFADENRLLITTSLTAQPNVVEWRIPRTEWFQVHLHDLSRQAMVTLMNDTPRAFNAVAGAPLIARKGDTVEILVEAMTLVEPQARQDLYRIDTEDGGGRVVSEGLPGRSMSWVMGPDGELVARAEFDDTRGVWALSAREAGRWRRLGREVVGVDAPGLVGLGRDGRSVALWREVDGETGLIEMSLADGAISPVDGGVEADQVIVHPRSRRLAGLVDLDGRGGAAVRFFDPEMAAVWAKVTPAFKGKTVRPLNWAADLSRLAVHVEGAGDPGSVWLVNMRTLAAEVVGDLYPKVAAAQVAAVRPVTYKAADGLEIRGFLTLPPGRDAKNLPLVVLPHGGPQAQDAGGFDWWAQALASRGYAVLQPNYRGSSGRGLSFVQAGYGEWGRKMQTDLSDGVRHLAAEGVVDPGRVCIVGGSYGGYAALAGVTLDGRTYRCAVSVNGLSDLRVFVADRARLAGARSATVRYWNRFMGVDRHTDKALDAVSPARQAAQAAGPVLLIHGRDDVVVPFAQSRIMEAALRRAGRPVRLVELAGEDHWLSRGETRLRMLEEAVSFLEQNNPPG